MKTRSEGGDTHVVVVEPQDTIMLTTANHDGRTCIYIRMMPDGRLVAEGGTSIQWSPSKQEAVAPRITVTQLSSAENKSLLRG